LPLSPVGEMVATSRRAQLGEPSCPAAWLAAQNRERSLVRGAGECGDGNRQCRSGISVMEGVNPKFGPMLLGAWTVLGILAISVVQRSIASEDQGQARRSARQSESILSARNQAVLTERDGGFWEAVCEPRTAEMGRKLPVSTAPHFGCSGSHFDFLKAAGLVSVSPAPKMGWTGDCPLSVSKLGKRTCHFGSSLG